MYICVFVCMQRLVCTNIVQLSGATGDNAHRINGYYEPIDEIVGNASVYKKMGDGADMWIEYDAAKGKWFVKQTSSRGKGKGWATATISPARPLEDCPTSCWEVYDGSNCVNQPSFSVSISSKPSLKAANAAAIEVKVYIYIYMIIYKIANTH